MYVIVNKHKSLVLFQVSVERVISERMSSSKAFNNQFNSGISLPAIKKSTNRKSFLYTYIIICRAFL